MIKRILSTVFVRGAMAAINFLLAIITSRYLGAEGKGDVSLFLLNLGIVQLVNNFVGGSYLIYLFPRKNTMQLIVPSYLWAILISVATPAVLYFLGLVENDLLIHLMIVSVLFCLVTVNSQLMLGKEEINRFNLSALFQVAVVLGTFFSFLLWMNNRSIESYVNALYISYCSTLILTFILTAKHFGKITFNGMGNAFRESINNGFLLQSSNIAQMLNYRLSFYILDKFPPAGKLDGREEVGIYSVAVSVSESVWLISQSVSLVLFSRISNTSDRIYSRKLTLALLKAAFVGTAMMMGVLLLFPSSFYQWIFGNEFGEVRTLLFPLSIGVIALSSGIILSSYFVGNGNTTISIVASVIGLVITVVSGFIFIPEYGMTGAALTATASYVSSVAYQFVCFIREAKEFTARDYFFSLSDVRMVIAEFKNMMKAGSKEQKA